MNDYTVYMHIAPNKKRYIGITSQEPNKRWQNGKGYKNNDYFTNAIEKYGWDNFEHIIIVKGLSKKEAEWLEIELIRELDLNNQDKGYNIAKGGNTTKGINPRDYMTEEAKKERDRKQSETIKGENHPMYGRHHTEESNEKNRKSHLGKGRGKENGNATPVICITSKSKRVFYTITEGSKHYKCDASTIRKCCKGKRKSCGKSEDGEPLVWKSITIIEL